MARTDNFKAPTGAGSRSEAWYEHKFGTAPENNGIDEHNEAAATVFDTTDDLLPGENQEGGRLEVSTPVEIIDEVSPVGDSEKAYAKAVAKNTKDTVKDPNEVQGPQAEDETINVEDTETEDPNSTDNESGLPPVVSEASSEEQVEIPTETDKLEADSNEPTETSPIEQTEGAEQTVNDVPAPANTPEVENVAPVEEPRPIDGSATPDKAVKDWTVKELDAWADANKAKDYPAASNKPEKVAYVEAALKGESA